MQIKVRVPTQLRGLADGEAVVTVDANDGAAGGVTVRSVLDALARAHPALERRVRDELGAVRVHVNLFVGADNVRDLDGLDSPVPPGAEVSIIPAVSGG